MEISSVIGISTSVVGLIGILVGVIWKMLNEQVKSMATEVKELNKSQHETTTILVEFKKELAIKNEKDKERDDAQKAIIEELRQLSQDIIKRENQYKDQKILSLQEKLKER